MSDLKVGQTQAFTVDSSDGSAVSGISVSGDSSLFNIVVTGDNAFTVTALAAGASSIQVSAPGFKPSDQFVITIVALPQLVIVPGAISGP